MDVPVRPTGPEAAEHVTSLYQAHALGLVRLAVVLLGDKPTAEDVVQDAFVGLYRRWRALGDHDRALAYLRASVVNGCRMVHRQRSTRDRIRSAASPGLYQPDRDAESAEATALIGEEHREVMAALHQLPARQREAVILRYWLDLSEDEAARVMRVSRGAVKSATSRGRAALGRMLTEES
jgi:RNA polymerase sigma-70 factor (sigma-E family)